MTTKATHTAAREYVWALLRMHELDPKGVIDSQELDSLCAEMESLWPKMNAEERACVSGLSADLYALADGRVGTVMSDEEETNQSQ